MAGQNYPEGFSPRFIALAKECWADEENRKAARDLTCMEFVNSPEKAAQHMALIMFGLFSRWFPQDMAPYVMADLQHLMAEGGHPDGLPCSVCTSMEGFAKVVTR